MLCCDGEVVKEWIRVKGVASLLIWRGHGNGEDSYVVHILVRCFCKYYSIVHTGIEKNIELRMYSCILYICI